MDEQILLKSKTNYECPSSQHPWAGGRAEGGYRGAAPGCRDGVGGEGPAVGSALGTGIQTAGCEGWVRYVVYVWAPGSLGWWRGVEGSEGEGRRGWHSPQLKGLCAGSWCQQWHLQGKVVSVPPSVFRWPSAFGVTSTPRAGCKGGVGLKSRVPPAHFGFAGELKTCKHCSAASWETSPQVPWQIRYRALKSQVDLGWVF